MVVASAISVHERTEGNQAVLVRSRDYRNVGLIWEDKAVAVRRMVQFIVVGYLRLFRGD
jgi:hypothetical protein